MSGKSHELGTRAMPPLAILSLLLVNLGQGGAAEGINNLKKLLRKTLHTCLLLPHLSLLLVNSSQSDPSNPSDCKQPHFIPS